jgi:ABC-type nitrate/sulfonate/bicarbonate transport system substrate-binding protein
VTAVRRSWANAHREAALRFVRAMSATDDFIRDPKNRDRVIKVIAEMTGASNDIAGKTLDLFFQPGRRALPDHAAIDLNGLQRVIAMMGEIGLIGKPPPQASRFVDLQYLHAAGVQ